MKCFSESHTAPLNHSDDNVRRNLTTMYGVCDLKPIVRWWPPSRTWSTAVTNTNIRDVRSKLVVSVPGFKWQTCHLKCMNTLCDAQQRSSSASWRIHPWGHSDWHSKAKLRSRTQLPVSLQNERPEVLARPGLLLRVNPGRCVNAGWGESLVSVSGSGQRGRDYSTNPMFVWHQRWSLNPDCCCIAITSLLVCQQTPPPP